MEIVRLKKVINVTNEISEHEAGNLIERGTRTDNGWLCQEGIKKASVTFQLEKPIILTSIKVENNNSSMVEILVGNSADLKNEFSSIVPVSVFMTPEECENGINQNLIKVFQEKDFREDAIKKVWDRLKVVCQQPYNKSIAFGIKFLEVTGKAQRNTSEPENEDEEKITIGSFFRKALSKKKNFDASTSDLFEVKTPPKLQTVEKETSLIYPKHNTNKKKKENKDKIPSKEKRKGKGDAEKKFLTMSDTKQKKKVKKKKPFGKLMEGVVFVISGFQNPLRGNIRSLALEMGAKYSPDWNKSCTHLVCAFENTPRFNQVKGKGKIVRKEWVEKCHSDRKLYPWRKFALDKNDLNLPESEEEIEELEGNPDLLEEELVPERPKASTQLTTSISAAETSTSSSFKLPTKKRKLEKEKIIYPQKVEKNEEEDIDYDLPTDEDESDVEKRDTSDYPLPFLKNILTSKVFYIDPSLKIRSIVERYIIAFDGTVVDHCNEDVNYYISFSNSDSSKPVSGVITVKPSWILDIINKEKFVDPAEHLA